MEVEASEQNHDLCVGQFLGCSNPLWSVVLVKLSLSALSGVQLL